MVKGWIKKLILWALEETPSMSIEPCIPDGVAPKNLTVDLLNEWLNGAPKGEMEKE